MDKILVVDDEGDIRDLSGVMLESAGYKVFTCKNGDEAISIARETLPDLVLMDIVMPGKSGLEACKILKEDAKTAQIPVVMFTALGREVDRKLGKDAGADGHFNKPFGKEELLDMVESKLEVSRLSRFSSSLGISHDQLLGRKMLFEYVPASPYDGYVRDFCLEARAHSEDVAVLTTRTSALYNSIKDDDGIDVVLYKDRPVFSPIIDEYNQGCLALVYDSISIHALSSGFNIAYGYVRNALELVGESRITALFLLNPEAHTSREVSSFHGLFSDQLFFGENGLEKTRFT